MAVERQSIQSRIEVDSCNRRINEQNALISVHSNYHGIKGMMDSRVAGRVRMALTVALISLAKEAAFAVAGLSVIRITLKDVDGGP